MFILYVYISAHFGYLRDHQVNDLAIAAELYGNHEWRAENF